MKSVLNKSQRTRLGFYTRLAAILGDDEFQDTVQRTIIEDLSGPSDGRTISLFSDRLDLIESEHGDRFINTNQQTSGDEIRVDQLSDKEFQDLLRFGRVLVEKGRFKSDKKPVTEGIVSEMSDQDFDIMLSNVYN